MITLDDALKVIPDGLRSPLLHEFSGIINNYLENRWSPAEISGGKFSEIVYTIIDGIAKGSFASSPSKPSNFIQSCRNFENQKQMEYSLRLLIPRILPALYEIRNNRGGGHAGAEVDPNYMDASAVVSMASWVMAELIRVFHKISITDAERLANHLVERRLPLVWKSDEGMRRVLNPNLSLSDQTLLLLFTVSEQVSADDLVKWLDYKNKGYYRKLLTKLHKNRIIEYDSSKQLVELLPPGTELATEIIQSNKE